MGALKLITEVSELSEDEIIIRCKSRSERIRYIESILENLLYEDARLNLMRDGTEYFIFVHDVLYFETEEDRICAHTKDGVYHTSYTLRELEKLLPDNFIRASKSCILNTSHVHAINRNLTGSSEVLFRDSEKQVFVSRMYYKSLREKLMESYGSD